MLDTSSADFLIDGQHFKDTSTTGIADTTTGFTPFAAVEFFLPNLFRVDTHHLKHALMRTIGFFTLGADAPNQALGENGFQGRTNKKRLSRGQTPKEHNETPQNRETEIWTGQIGTREMYVGREHFKRR